MILENLKVRRNLNFMNSNKNFQIKTIVKYNAIKRYVKN